GSGIDNITINKIFDPFFTTKKDGTGMGLYIVYNIVKIHFGDIQVDSKPGLTTFKIILRGAL
ncbi:MAG: two-component sensor histidine kinase, partial [Calditerrivibrio sp.]|nr:two-component sensor histidine kinase [Calditerrivibrio sp.]